MDRFADHPVNCDYPLEPAFGVNDSIQHKYLFICGFSVGWAVFFLVSFAIGLFLPVDKYFIKLENIKWKKKPPEEHQPSPPTKTNDKTMVSMMEKTCTRMSYHELKDATNNFSNNNIIAGDGAGITYKAVLPNKQYLAIKRFHPFRQREYTFISEFMTLGRLKHANLVRLMGFCISSDARLLVYKFIENGSLHDCLFSRKLEAKVLGWPMRVNIAIGIAKGIVWLHRNNVAHGGISSKSVLLDINYSPKISGSYIKHPLLVSYEDDVFGYGNLLLELITRKKRAELCNGRDGEEHVRSIIEQEGGAYDSEMYGLLRIALKCIDPDPSKRPDIFEVFRFHLPLRWVLHY